MSKASSHDDLSKQHRMLAILTFVPLACVTMVYLLWFQDGEDPANATSHTEELEDSHVGESAELTGPSAELKELDTNVAFGERGGKDRQLVADVSPELEQEAGAEEAPEPASTGLKVAFSAVDCSGDPVRDQAMFVTLHGLPRNSIGEASWQLSMPVTSDASGSSAFVVGEDELGGGLIDVSVQIKGTAAKGWLLGVAAPKQGQLELRALTLCEPRELYISPLVTGRVLGDDGLPVKNAMGVLSAGVYIEHEEGAEPRRVSDWPLLSESQVVIDAVGNFEAFGPPGAVQLDLVFLANGYGDERLSIDEPPSLGNRVEMARRLRWKGKLLAPSDGPPLTEYGIWVSQEGEGIGISPRENGSFGAIGNSRALNLKVTHPGMGAALYRKEFVFAPDKDMDLGVIDIRPLVQVIDLIVEDGDGNPLAAEVLDLWVDGAGSIGGGYKTSDQGRLWTVVPAGAELVEVSRRHAEATKVTLESFSGRIQAR